MNVVSRGVKNALRSPLRSGAIVIMLAISIGLILSMLVARSSVETKIADVKASAGTKITISPAGVNGFAGGGDYLTSTELATIKSTANITSTVSTISDQMSTGDTNLTTSLTMGSMGARMDRFDSSSSSNNTSTIDSATTSTAGNATSSEVTADSTRPTPTPRITVTGTTDANSVSTDGSDLVISSGVIIDGASSELIALVGTDLATKNNLTVGSTFTAYSKTVTVVGIYKTGNTFQDSNIIMPLATVQSLTGETDSISSVVATVNSSDNVSSTVNTLKSTLSTKADIVSEVEQAATSVSSLSSISSLALAGVIGATIAGAVIVLLAMVMVVRERRHEIGVIKAIGGSNLKVMGQFISEALTLTVIGSIIGLVFGVLASGPMTSSLVSSQASSSSTAQISSTTGGQGGPGKMMQQGMAQISQNFTSITSSVTPQVFIMAIGITLIIAIVGSAVPAWFISRVRPAEVLRTE